jgi:hypothetical protein
MILPARKPAAIPMIMYHKNPIAFKFYVVIVYITAHGGMKFIAVKDSFFKTPVF